MSMDDRESAFENKFAHDEAFRFRVEARACKLFGLWLAGEMGLSASEAEAYAKTVVGANLDEAGFNDVLRAVRPDIEAKGLSLSDDALNARLDSFMDEAKKQLTQEQQG